MQGAHGSLLGRGETSKKRTYPTVQVHHKVFNVLNSVMLFEVIVMYCS